MADEEKQNSAKQEEQAGGNTEKKRGKKITRMSLTEIEKALEQAQKQMGGNGSAYARFLLARREVLKAQSQGSSLRKAA